MSRSPAFIGAAHTGVSGPWGFDLGKYKPYEVISLRGDLSDTMGSIKFGANHRPVVHLFSRSHNRPGLVQSEDADSTVADVMVQQEGVRRGPPSHLPHSQSTDSFSGSSGVSGIDQFSEASQN